MSLELGIISRDSPGEAGRVSVSEVDFFTALDALVLFMGASIR